MWNIHHVESNIQDNENETNDHVSKFAKLYLRSRGRRFFVVGFSWGGGHMPMLAPLVTVLVELERVRS